VTAATQGRPDDEHPAAPNHTMDEHDACRGLQHSCLWTSASPPTAPHALSATRRPRRHARASRLPGPTSYPAPGRRERHEHPLASRLRCEHQRPGEHLAGPGTHARHTGVPVELRAVEAASNGSLIRLAQGMCARDPCPACLRDPWAEGRTDAPQGRRPPAVGAWHGSGMGRGCPASRGFTCCTRREEDLPRRRGARLGQPPHTLPPLCLCKSSRLYQLFVDMSRGRSTLGERERLSLLSGQA